MAYIAAIASHPSYTVKFNLHLVQPGLRIPITSDPKFFADAVKIGKEVLWLHTFGDRFVDAKASRPSGPPRLPDKEQPKVPKGGAIPSADLPENISYDPSTHHLKIGTGYIENVPPEVWSYEVSGKRVLTQCFSYRARDRTRPMIGHKRPPSPLGKIQPDGWLSKYTSELLNVLNVLGLLVKEEPAQAQLLDQICAGFVVSLDDLKAAIAAEKMPVTKKPAKRRNAKQGELLG